MPADKVFISYSHDSPEHSDRVLALANALRKSGLRVELDQFVVRPPHGFERWCTERLRPENSRFVLMICTAEYYAGVENLVAVDKRRGVFWEGALIHNYLYKEKANKRFIPVLFDDTHEDHVPDAFQQHRRYRLKAFDFSDPDYDDLYRELTDQPEIIPAEIGVIVSRPPRTIPKTAPSAAPRFDIDRIYKYAPETLIGREAETAVIAEAWDHAVSGASHPHVLTFVALGGGGKTSLVAKWANHLAARGWPDCEAAFAWTFYAQGASEQAGASSDLFFAEALKFFRLAPIEGESGYDKGKRLAREIGVKRALLILDGLEPLQYTPSPAHPAELKDDGLRGLLRGLATRNAGLCLVTTRYKIDDLKGYAATAPQRDLLPLSDPAGAKLLTALDVKGTEKERRDLSAYVKGHALTLEIVGGYLKEAHGGDIRKRALIKFEAADAHELNGHAFRAMAAYASWFESAGADGARALAMLRLTGLFDRPASAGCLAALWRAPAMEGLTEPLVDLGDEQRNLVLSRLEGAKLLTVTRDASLALIEIDAHPLLREFFASQLRERPAWQAAHRRLYEHLTTTTKDKPAPSLDDLQPLYQAIAHGCAAGLWQEACDKVYNARICRSGEAYVIKKLGAFGALYVGVTNDLARRAWQHRTGQGSQFATKYRVTQLVWYEAYADVQEAIRREKQLKGCERRWKLESNERMNPTWKDLYEELNN